MGCVVLIEAGWLAIWPLSGSLSHSPPFTSAVLQQHPLVNHIYQLTLNGARAVLPTLGDTPLTDPLGASVYGPPTVALAGVMLWLAAAYALALILLDTDLGARRVALWTVLGGAIVFQVTLLFLPGLFSQDV